MSHYLLKLNIHLLYNEELCSSLNTLEELFTCVPGDTFKNVHNSKQTKPQIFINSRMGKYILGGYLLKGRGGDVNVKGQPRNC